MTKKCPKCQEVKFVEGFHIALKRADGLRAWCKVCERASYRTKSAGVRNQVFDKLGHSCNHCGFTDKRALQIDHVNGGGNKEHAEFSNTVSYLRKVLIDTDGTYQILCANCNWIKKSERMEVVLESRLTEQGRLAISASRKAWTPTEEQRANMSKSHLGQEASQELRDKRVIITSETWKDPEVRRKRVDGIKAAIARKKEAA